MGSAVHIIKIVAALVCIAAATVCLFVALPYVVPLGIVGIGWAMIPE